MLVFSTNLSFMEFVIRYLAVFFSKRRLRVVLDGKFSQEHAVNNGVTQGFILGPTLFLLCINYADDTTLYSKCDQATDLWQKLKLTSELESDLETL